MYSDKPDIEINVTMVLSILIANKMTELKEKSILSFLGDSERKHRYRFYTRIRTFHIYRYGRVHGVAEA